MESTSAPDKPLSPEAQLDAAKAAFEQAKRKTALQQGLVDAAGKETKDAPIAPREAPKAAEPEKPAPKPKKAKPVAAAAPAPAPKPEPTKPDPMEAVTAQLKALEEKLSALTRDDEEDEPEEQPENPLDGIRGELTERFGEEEAGALVKALEALHAPSSKRIAQLEKVIQDAAMHGKRQVSKNARTRLSESYPHLSTSDEAWQMLDALVEQRAKSGKYSSVDEVYDDVSTKLFGGLVKAPEAAEEEPEDVTEELAERIAASQMTAPSRSGGKNERSRIDKMREHFDFLKKHPEDKAGAKRLARELGIDR